MLSTGVHAAGERAQQAVIDVITLAFSPHESVHRRRPDGSWRID